MTTESTKLRFRRVLLGGLALAFAGCGLDEMSERFVSLAEMPCSGITAGGAWESHPVPVSDVEEEMGDAGTSGVCGWMVFENRERLVVAHDLGRQPGLVIPYVAFRPSGVGATPGSGDLARIMYLTDTEVVIENRTDERFYLRLVVE